MQKQQHNFSFGIQGEKKAAEFLVSNGYKILNTNYSYQDGEEIDIIAFDTNYQELVFVEVKTRMSDYYGSPSDAVTSSKIRKLTWLAERYLREHPSKHDYRFDIISICDDEIDHFENVTWLN